jgi:hypothetical protein
MIGYIYVTITDDGCYYIGQHKRKSFDKSYKGSGKLLSEKCIVECRMIDQADTIEDLHAKEKYWIHRCASKMGEKCLNIDARASGGTQLVYVHLKTKDAFYDVNVLADRYKVSISTVYRWINRFGSEPKAWSNAKERGKKLKKYQRELMYDWVLMSMNDYFRVKDFNIK